VPSKGATDIFIPEFFERTAKLVIVDEKNTALFESGEEISIDCDKKDHDGNWMDGQGQWKDGERNMVSGDGSSSEAL
jgi:hypothetical protein